MSGFTFRSEPGASAAPSRFAWDIIPPGGLLRHGQFWPWLQRQATRGRKHPVAGGCGTVASGWAPDRFARRNRPCHGDGVTPGAPAFAGAVSRRAGPRNLSRSCRLGRSIRVVDGPGVGEGRVFTDPSGNAGAWKPGLELDGERGRAPDARRTGSEVWEVGWTGPAPCGFPVTVGWRWAIAGRWSVRRERASGGFDPARRRPAPGPGP